MAYDLLDASENEVLDDAGQPIHQRYLLSLQDLDRSAYLSELIDAGVTTFKIEGRLKDADYVTNITAYYREKLDKIINHKFENINGFVYSRTFVPNPEKTFHRGATDYFLHGRTAHLANWNTPKSTGEYIGSVLEARGNTLRVRLNPGIALHNGDGLTIGAEGCSVNGVEGNLIKINKEISIQPSAFREIPLYRNLDVEFTKNLKSERRIPVDILFRETENGFLLRIGEHERSFAYPHEEAKNAERALDTIRTQLTKLGDTPYIARSVQIESRPYFIPISIINEWRRKTLNGTW
jgi:putative protease